MAALAVALAVLTTACGQRDRVRVTAPMRAGVVPTPLLVMQPRVCVDRVQSTARRTPSRSGLASTTAAHARLLERIPGLGRAVAVALPCAEIAYVSDDAAPPPPLRASREVLTAMRERGGRSALVTEISARLGCHDSALFMHYAGARGGGRREDARCYEEDVRVSVFVFAADGALLWAASREVSSVEDASAAVDELLSRAPVTPTRPCRLDATDRADCT
jgi:hypothetical protein